MTVGIGIFRRKYTVRRFKPQEEVPGGYVTSQYEDVVTSLNVQPLSGRELMALPEGERSTKRLKAYGDLQLITSDQDNGILGDWLFYRGSWYRCVSAAIWDHTLLAHCQSEFVKVPESEIPHNMEPPGKDEETAEIPAEVPEETQLPWEEAEEGED